VIVLNTVHMCVEAEYRGWAVGNTIGNIGITGTTGATTDSGDNMFHMFELLFAIVFTFEILVKILALGFKCFKWNAFGRWNVFDIVVICANWFTMFSGVDTIINPLFLRLFRLLRLLRLLRGLSQYEMCDDLQLMVRALGAGAPVLIWVLVLVGPTLACFALAMNYMLVDFLADESKPMKDRVDCFNFFGTFSNAFLSMFEVTFANWVPICRFLHKNVDERYALFFMGWKLGRGIAVLHIIYGVFLHVTVRCA